MCRNGAVSLRLLQSVSNDGLAGNRADRALQLGDRLFDFRLPTGRAAMGAWSRMFSNILLHRALTLVREFLVHLRCGDVKQRRHFPDAKRYRPI